MVDHKPVNLRILYVGQTWEGSSARSLRDALQRRPDVVVEDIAEDRLVFHGRSFTARTINRLDRSWREAVLVNQIRQHIETRRPTALVVYKGALVAAKTVRLARAKGLFTVNVFPDYSPHAYGQHLRAAMGEYDLVISTKPFHPANWWSVYGYRNSCVCVPHGYDPAIHYWSTPPAEQNIDLVLAATWRPQYHQLMVDLSRKLDSSAMNVLIAGEGWKKHCGEFPRHWQFAGGQYGLAYGELVRRGKIILAPVHQEVIVDGARQPGDEDSTRSYELASAGCFFLHRRTPYIQTIYSEDEEVPMWSNADELAKLVRHFLPLDETRRRMAARAHARAVPDYSIDTRARKVAQILRERLCLNCS